MSEYWGWLYKVAADMPDRPSPKTQRAYEEFFRALRVVIPDESERRLYKSITTQGPFKLTGDTFAKGPETAVEFVADVHNGILIRQGKQPEQDAQALWKLLKYKRSTRNNAQNENNENNNNSYFSTVLADEAHHDALTKNGKLVVVMYDQPHFMRRFPRPDKQAAKIMAEIRGQFGDIVKTAVAPGNMSYTYWWRWKQRIGKFPYWRMYKNGKVVTESSNGEDMRHYLKLLKSRGQQVQYTMHNAASVNHGNTSRRAPERPSPYNGLAYGLSKGVGESLGRAGVQTVTGPVHVGSKLARLFM